MSDTQPYTYWAWLDVDDVICEGGFCPTESLGEYPNWDRANGWRYLEHDLPELVSETTHYFDAADGTIKRREDVGLYSRSAVSADLPPMPRRPVMQ